MSPAPDSRSFELSAIQSRVARILEDLHHPPLGMAAALSEECGEVSALLLDHHAYGKPLDLEALAGELVDVLVCLCEIATHHGADMQEAAERKLADIEARAPEWRKEFGDALRRARGET